jgi:thioesterase domain-containing protein
LANRATDPLLDWGGRTEAPLEVADMPGGHSSMLQEPHVEKVAEYMISHIDQTLAAAASL